MAGLQKENLTNEVLTELSWIMNVIDDLCEKARLEPIPVSALARTRHPDHPGHQAGRGRALLRTHRQKAMVTARRRSRKTRHTLAGIHRLVHP